MFISKTTTKVKLVSGVNPTVNQSKVSGVNPTVNQRPLCYGKRQYLAHDWLVVMSIFV